VTQLSVLWHSDEEPDGNVCYSPVFPQSVADQGGQVLCPWPSWTTSRRDLGPFSHHVCPYGRMTFVWPLSLDHWCQLLQDNSYILFIHSCFHPSIHSFIQWMLIARLPCMLPKNHWGYSNNYHQKKKKKKKPQKETCVLKETFLVWLTSSLPLSDVLCPLSGFTLGPYSSPVLFGAWCSISNCWVEQLLLCLLEMSPAALVVDWLCPLKAHGCGGVETANF
jgi:hypothetical protein